MRHILFGKKLIFSSYRVAITLFCGLSFLFLSILMGLFSCSGDSLHKKSFKNYRESFGPQKTVSYYKGKIDYPLATFDDLYKGKLAVVATSPNGILANTNSDTYIYIVFSKQMVSPKVVGLEKKSMPFVQIEPVVEGRYFWAGENVLIFKPEGGHFADGSYKVTIKGGIKSIAGEALGANYSFDFSPRPFKVNDFWQGEKDSIVNNTLRSRDGVTFKRGKSFYLQTNYYLPLKQLKKLLSFQNRLENVKYKIKLVQSSLSEKGEAIYRIKFLTKVPQGALVQLFYNRYPIDGLSVSFQKAFSVVDAYFDYDYEQLFLEPTKPVCKYLNILCSSNIDKNSCEGKITINGQQIDKSFIEVKGNQIVIKTIEGLASNGTVKIGVASSLLDQNKKPMSAPFYKEIEVEKFDPYLYVPYQNVSYISKKNPALYLEALGLKGGRWDFFKSQNDSKLYYTLPFNFDQNRYPNISECELNQFRLLHNSSEPFYGKIALEPGHLTRNKTSVAPTNKSYKFYFTPFALTVAVARESVLVLVKDLEEGVPLPGVDVVLKSATSRVELKSSSLGVALFDRPFNDLDHQTQSFTVELNNLEDHIEFDVVPNSVSESKNSSYPNLATIFTNKASYVSAANIYATIIDPYVVSKKVAINSTLVLEKTSLPKRKYHTVTLKSSQSGIWSTTYSLPENLPSGDYQLVYKSKFSNGVVPIKIDSQTENQLSLEVNKKSAVSGEKFEAILTNKDFKNQTETPQLDQQTSSSQTNNNMESKIAIRQTLLPYQKNNFPNSFIGPYDFSTLTKNYQKTVYCDDNGIAYYSLEAGEFYREVPRFPSRLDIVPIEKGARATVNEVTKSIELFPSSFFIAAKIRSRSSGYKVKMNKSFHIDYQLIDVKGRPLTLANNLGSLVLEVSPMGKEGELLGLTGKMTKSLRKAKGSFKLKLYSAGAFFITLRASDPYGNQVVTEFPLYVEGQKSNSNYFQIKPTFTYAQAGREFPFWVNIPDSYSQSRYEGLLIKSSDSITTAMPVILNRGSQFISITIEENDLPCLSLTLLLFSNSPSGKNSGLSSLSYTTAVATTNIFVRPSSEEVSNLQIYGLDGLVANSNHLVDFDFSSFKEEQSGEFTYGFVKKVDGDKLSLSGLEELCYDYQFSRKALELYDIKSHMGSGKLDKAGVEQIFYNGHQDHFLNQIFFPAQGIKFSGKQKQQLQILMPKEGEYFFTVIGVCEGKPFLKSLPVVVSEQGLSSLKVDIPNRILKRETIEAKVNLDFLPLNREALSGQIRVTSSDKKSSTGGLILSASKFELNWQNGFTSTFELSASSVGNYIIEIEYRLNNLVRKIEIPIVVEESDMEVTYSWFTQDSNVMPLIPFPKKEELSRLFSPAINLETSSLLKMKWHQTISILNDGVKSDFLDNRISALFPYYQIKRNFPYSQNSDKPVSYATSQEILNTIINLQNPDGGYPVCVDKNYDSDFYTTLRIADLLEFSNLPYYNYTIVWSLLQYVKSAFKGSNAMRDSYYLRCYAAWILSRYNENVVLVAKNLLEERRGCLAESNLAALALVNGGKKYRIDVGEYLEDHLARVLKIYDPTLSSVIKEGSHSFYSYKEDGADVAFGYDRPQNGGVEAALSFLFLQLLGGHEAESLRALEIMLLQDPSNLNDLDASFYMRAFYVAFQKGYLKRLFDNQDNGNTNVALRYGNDLWLELKGQGSALASDNYAPHQMPLPDQKKQFWNVATLGQIKSATKIDLKLSSPIELIPSRNCGYTLLAKWVDQLGGGLKGDNLNLGRVYHFHLYVSSYSGTKPIVLNIPFSSALFEIESVVSLCSDIKQVVPIKKKINQDSINLTYSDFPFSFDEVIITLRPKYNGTFFFPPIKVTSPFDTRLYAMSEGSLIRVSPVLTF